MATTLQKASAIITSDAASSARHWTQVRDKAKEKLARHGDAPASSRFDRMDRRHAERQFSVADAALALIARTGMGPRDLTMGGAAAELGL